MRFYETQPGANQDDTFRIENRVTATAFSIEQAG
jgi:hypothetical protein